jgi:hypothetical protein
VRAALHASRRRRPFPTWGRCSFLVGLLLYNLYDDWTGLDVEPVEDI